MAGTRQGQFKPQQDFNDSHTLEPKRQRQQACHRHSCLHLYIYIYICVHRHSSVFNILIHCLYFLNISNVFAICPTWLLWGAIHSGQPKHDLVRTDNHKTPWSIETWARLRAGGQPGLRLCFVYLVCTIYPYIGICIYICIYVLYIELYLFEKCSYILIDIHMFVYFPTCL